MLGRISIEKLKRDFKQLFKPKFVWKGLVVYGVDEEGRAVDMHTHEIYGPEAEWLRNLEESEYGQAVRELYGDVPLALHVNFLSSEEVEKINRERER